jgi:hypothetical protein
MKVKRRKTALKSSKDSRGSKWEKYRAFVHAKARGTAIDESELEPVLVLLGKSFDAFDKDVARVVQQNKSAAKMKEADGRQPKIDRLAEQVAVLDREREKLAAEFRTKVEAIQEKRETAYDEYRTEVEIQRATRQDAQRALTN